MDPNAAREAEAWYREAVARQRARRGPEALDAIERALALGGERVEFLVLRALVLHDGGDLAAAERALERVAQLLPGVARAHLELGSVRLDRGRARESIDCFQRALELDPGSARARVGLARAHLRLGDSESAASHARAALAAEPDLGNARLLLAEVLADSGEAEAARSEYRAAAALQPANLRAALGAQLLLPQVAASREHLERAREEYARGLDRLDEMAARFRFANAEEALALASWANFHLAYQGHDDRALQSRYGDFLARVLEPAAPALFRPIERRRARQRIRVGFMSHFLVDGSVGRYFGSWIARLDAARFEAFVYHSHEAASIVEGTPAVLRELAGLPMAARAQRVLDDALDVLVYPEMGMHNVTFALGALRLAPVQCVAWGHPDTTGHRNADWFVSSAAMEPAEGQDHYRERLALLPGLGTHYAMPRAPGSAGRAQLGLPDGCTLYLVPQSLFKIHPDSDALFARVLAHDPGGVAIFFEATRPVLTRAFADRLRAELARHGVSFDRQVRFLPRVSHDRYLQVNAACDVLLDTMHWSGGNTALDAIACGLPLVTLRGPLMRGRQSAAMLELMQMPEFVARDADDYVAIAARLGADADARREVRAHLLARREALFGRDEPIRALEDFLERAVSGIAD